MRAAEKDGYTHTLQTNPQIVEVGNSSFSVLKDK